MKIAQLKIEGYKSLKSVAWEPGDLNVVIGPNGGGKSNLISALGLFRETSIQALQKRVASLGGVQTISWDGRLSTITFSPSTQWVVGDKVITKFRQVLVTNTAVNVTERTAPTGHGDTPEEAIEYAENEFKYDTSYFPQWLILDEFHTDRDSEVRRDTVSRVETQLEPDGQNLVAVLHTHYTNNREFKKTINDAMTAAFGDEFEEILFPPSADQRIQMRIRWKSLKRTYSTANLSDGTLRFLFLITALSQPDPPTLIAIDEPETGLHPSMMQIIADHAADAALRTQVVLTTHSAQFLDAIGQHNLTVTICEMHDGETKLRVLSGDDLRYWLDKYTLGELRDSGQLDLIGAKSSPVNEAAA